MKSVQHVQTSQAIQKLQKVQSVLNMQQVQFVQSLHLDGDLDLVDSPVVRRVEREVAEGYQRRDEHALPVSPRRGHVTNFWWRSLNRPRHVPKVQRIAVKPWSHKGVSPNR